MSLFLKNNFVPLKCFSIKRERKMNEKKENERRLSILQYGHHTNFVMGIVLENILKMTLKYKRTHCTFYNDS
jgi:hypothetical protein